MFLKSRNKLTRILAAFSLFIFMISAFGTETSVFADDGAKIVPSGDATGQTDYQNIQAALDKGGKITLCEGNYYINMNLTVSKNNTEIYAAGAFIKRINFGGLLSDIPSESSDSTGGYDSLSNVTVDGGTWSATVDKDDESQTGFCNFYFRHANNINIKNLTVNNNVGAHLIEFAGVRDSSVVNCRLGGIYKGDHDRKEAIQLDTTYSYEATPGGAPYDSTPCKNILIEKNTIIFPRGIGSHKGIYGCSHSNITIRDNIITAELQGIKCLDYVNCTIENNVITSKDDGIEFHTASSDKTGSDGDYSKRNPYQHYNLVITGNTIKNCTTNGIQIKGFSDQCVRKVSVSKNTISNITGRAITMEYCISSSVSNNVISGISGQNACAVFIKNKSTGANITGNSISNINGNAVSISYGSDRAAVKNNKISNAKNIALKINSSASANVSDNTLSNSGKNGVYLSSAPSSQINNNSISQAGANGIAVSDSDSVSVKGNRVTKVAGHGVSISKSARAKVNSNTVDSSGSSGIYIKDKSDTAKVWGNTVCSPKQTGISLNGVTGAYVSGNKISGSGSNGIRLYLAGGSVLDNNIYSCAKSGISAYNLSADIKKNVIRKCAYSGIYLEDMSKSSIVKNRVSDTNKNALRIEKSDSVKINGNVIKKSKYSGISSDSSKTLSIKKNSISDTNASGVYLSNVRDSSVSKNKMKKLKGCGVSLLKGNSVTVNKNIISNTKYSSVRFEKTKKIKVAANTLTKKGKSPSALSSIKSSKVDIRGNKIFGKCQMPIYIDRKTKNCNTSSMFSHSVSAVRKNDTSVTVKTSKAALLTVSAGKSKTIKKNIASGRIYISLKKRITSKKILITEKDNRNNTYTLTKKVIKK